MSKSNPKKLCDDLVKHGCGLCRGKVIEKVAYYTVCQGCGDMLIPAGSIDNVTDLCVDKRRKALQRVFDEIDMMDDEEFAKVIEKHKDGDIALMFMEFLGKRDE